MNTTQQVPCKCATCPGTSCRCGCQQSGCACGPTGACGNAARGAQP